MKKFLCLAVILFCSASVFAQLYIRGNVGYNLPLNAQRVGADLTQNDDGGSLEAVYGSYGSGFSIHAALGSTINGAIGYDLEIGYLLGQKYSVTSLSTFSDFREEEKSFTRSFQFAPSITLTAGSGKIKPYTRIGPVIAITKMILENTEDNEGDNYYMERELTGGMSLGFKGVFGATFNGDEKLQFFAELSFVGLSFTPTNGEITGLTYNGENILDNFDDEDRKVKFKKKITDDDNGNVILADKYSMGSIGLQVGIRYRLK